MVYLRGLATRKCFLKEVCLLELKLLRCRNIVQLEKFEVTMRTNVTHNGNSADNTAISQGIAAGNIVIGSATCKSLF